MWRHPGQNRINARPSSQFVGAGDETITLTGVLLPEVTGGELSLDALRKMTDTGKSYPLIDGRGTVHGQFAIERISKGNSGFFSDGAARKIEFSLTLKRTDNRSLGMINEKWLSLANMGGLF